MARRRGDFSPTNAAGNGVDNAKGGKERALLEKARGIGV
jgi:hypothetical protein